MRSNPPPGWPTPPPGWSPPPGWQPDPSWPAPPPGWQLWVPEAPPRRRRTAWIVAVVAAATAAVVTAVGVVAYATGVAGLGRSDSDEIRAVVAGMEHAYNDSDVDLFRRYLCADTRSGFSAGDFGRLSGMGGTLRLTVREVDVAGPTATADVTFAFDELGGIGAQTETWDFVREDDLWRACAFAR